MNVAYAVRKLSREGWLIIETESRAPNEARPSHAHMLPEHFLVLEGSLTVELRGVSHTLYAGDEFTAPAMTRHSETAGPRGATVIVAG